MANGMASFSIYTDHGLSDDEDHPARAEAAEVAEVGAGWVTWRCHIFHGKNWEDRRMNTDDTGYKS